MAPGSRWRGVGRHPGYTASPVLGFLTTPPRSHLELSLRCLLYFLALHLRSVERSWRLSGVLLGPRLPTSFWKRTLAGLSALP